jgi:hypothetical protein
LNLVLLKGGQEGGAAAVAAGTTARRRSPVEVVLRAKQAPPERPPLEADLRVQNAAFLLLLDALPRVGRASGGPLALPGPAPAAAPARPALRLVASSAP